MKMGEFEIIDIFSKKMSKNPTPLTVDPIYFYIIFFAGIVFSGSLYPVAKIIENLKYTLLISLRSTKKVSGRIAARNINCTGIA